MQMSLVEDEYMVETLSSHRLQGRMVQSISVKGPKLRNVTKTAG